jgi:hypothetical protein
MSKHNNNYVKCMRIVTAPGSKAETKARGEAAILPAALAPGFPSTPKHDLIFHGGRTLAQMSFFDFFVGGAAAWAASDITNINNALQAAMSDQHLNNVVQQYFHTPVSSKMLGSKVLAGAPPKLVTQGDIEDLVTRMFTAGNLSTPDFTSTIFNFMLPSGTILNDDPGTSTAALSAEFEGGHEESIGRPAAAIPKPDEGDSTNGLGGYHGSVHVAGTIVYYAVGVFSETRPDGSTNGIVAFNAPWKNVVATFYHEMQEFRTDPDVEEANRGGTIKMIGWTSRQGEEIGDFPVFEANPLSKVFKEVPLTAGGGTVPIQLIYSNAVHGPEGPINKPH